MTEDKITTLKNSFNPLLVLSICLFMHFVANAQFSGLQRVSNTKSDVYFSVGHEQRANEIAKRTQAAIEYNAKLLGFTPDVVVLALSAEDWSKHTSFPYYGMPHFKDSKTLIVATSDNDLWKSFIPPMDKLPAELANQIKQTYKTVDGNLSMQPFFDLLALHELGHAFHNQGKLKMQRKWMGELFCNILLHTYIAENEPGLLPALTLFPQMVVNTGSKGLTFITLSEFEHNYNDIAQKHPKNYGWYQCRLHAAARQIFDEGGKEVLVKLWNVLREHQTILTDAEFAALLQSKVHGAVANVMLKW